MQLCLILKTSTCRFVSKRNEFFIKKERRPLLHINIIVYLDCDIGSPDVYIMNVEPKIIEPWQKRQDIRMLNSRSFAPLF